MSRVAALDPGDVITAVDGVPIERWIAPIRAVIAESSAREVDALVFLRAFMLPERFTLTLANGRHVPVDRASASVPRKGPPNVEATTVTERPGGVVVIAIPSFGDPKFEEAAVAAVKAHADARLILFDVRGNGGGSSPGKLAAAIMTAPYAGTIVDTPMSIAEFDAHGSFDPNDNPLPKAMARYGPDVTQPVSDAFRGRTALLADRHCASACEDLVIRFKTSHRGPVMGEATWGSTGQPYRVTFPDLGMEFRVSTKREYFPDGAPFEGIGVAPDIAVPLTAADLRSTGDPQLERAIKAALAAR